MERQLSAQATDKGLVAAHSGEEPPELAATIVHVILVQHYDRQTGGARTTHLFGKHRALLAEEGVK